MDSISGSAMNVTTKVTRDIVRPNGSQVRIVAQTMFGQGLNPGVDLYVLRRESEMQPWHYCRDRPAATWREMSVEQYKREGRSEMLQVASPGEILSVISLLGRPSAGLAGLVN